MIRYRKSPQLRVRRRPAPEPPWWFATAVSPYSGRRAQPLAIDYLTLEASSQARLEVTVCEEVRDALDRAALRQPLRGPVLIDAAGTAEEIFRRGEAALRFCRERDLATIVLLSPDSGAIDTEGATAVLAAWPPALDRIAAAASAMRAPWGMAVPLLYPVTTDLETLERLAAIAREGGAAFLAPVAVEADPTAKQALAGGDEETYANLFHADLEPLTTATERHLAALAAEGGMADFVVPPRWEERSNWNAAVLLTLTASRMLAMGDDIELAGAIARSARVVADLDKPLVRIAEAASLSIVEALDEASADIAGDWLEGVEGAFVARVNARWRLRRDAGMGPA